MASSSTPDSTEPLLPAAIDELARSHPHRPWASIPVDDNDLTQGYEDISYEALANAINKLAWIIHSSVGKSTTFATIAYLGASDLRYHMMQMAACKTGHKVLFSSHLNSLSVHLSLMDKLDCKSLFYSEGTQVDDILAARSIKHILVPSLDVLIDVDNRAECYPYTKTYEDAAFDPYAVLHTSGTTGDPKPLLFNHAITKSFYLQKSLPDVEGRSHIVLSNPGIGTRVFLPTSPFHVLSSVSGLSLSVLGGGVLVLPCRNRGMSVTDSMLDVFTYANAKYAILMPHYMEAIARKPNPEDYIKNFEVVYFGGGELSPLTRTIWAKYTRIQNCWGSSELGFPPQLESDVEDHEYVYFDMEHSGLEFREVKMDDDPDEATSAKIYEMVLAWSPLSAKYSAQFAREGTISGSGPPYPDYHIGDLWAPHSDPKKSRYAWRFVGRKDDLITLAAGINLRTGTIEQALLAHSQVKAAIVLGNKRLQPLAVLELVPNTPLDAAQEIWKSILEPLNAKMQSHSRIANTHVLVVPADGLIRTPKGTISRKKSENKYAKEIDAVYQRFGDTWQDKGLPVSDNI
ncbi:acetyl-CoA synthetase-like protein [Xylaria sp. FL1042]|nr:acetyl-CoA synthetase-like protein [Xylaria sp. FL1042]